MGPEDPVRNPLLNSDRTSSSHSFLRWTVLELAVSGVCDSMPGKPSDVKKSLSYLFVADIEDEMRWEKCAIINPDVS
jgi:hypothetical protein